MRWLYIINLVLVVITVTTACYFQSQSQSERITNPSSTDKKEGAIVETDDWVVQLRPGTDPQQLANDHSAVLLGQVGSLKDTWLLRRPGFELSESQDPFRLDPKVIWLERQVRRQMQKKPVSTE